MSSYVFPQAAGPQVHQQQPSLQRPVTLRRQSSISYSNGSSVLNSSRTPSRSRPRWLVAVTPTAQLAAIFDTIDTTRTILLPLQASLHAQLLAVSRDLGLRGPVGLTLSVSLGAGLPSALFIEESWAIAWAHLFTLDGQSSESSSGHLSRGSALNVSQPLFSSLPIAALLEVGWDTRQSRRESFENVSPTLKLRPAPLSLHIAARRASIDERQQAVPDPEVLNVLAKPDDDGHPENNAQSAIVDEQKEEDDTDSWPPTPPSPDRLPSESLVDRLAFSPTEMLPARCFPDYITGGSDFGRAIVMQGSRSLIEQATDVKMRSLAECSEPSPIEATYFAPRCTVEEGLRYPYNPYAIYQPVYPHFDLYPAQPSLTICKRQQLTAARTSSPGTDRYPYNLYGLYSPVYPHFDLYPGGPLSEQKPITHRLAHQPSRMNLAYPYSLSAIYPARYPFFDIYPSEETCRLGAVDRQTDLQRASIISLPRRKLSASRLSPIFTARSVLQARVLDSPSEKIDSSSSRSVAEFRKKRGKQKRRSSNAIVLMSRSVPAPLKPFDEEISTREGSRMPRRPSTPRRPNIGGRALTSPCLPMPALSPGFGLASPAMPVSAH